MMEKETGEKFWDEAIEDRIAQILGGHMEEIREYYDAQELVLKHLDLENIRWFEQWTSHMETITLKENVAIYKEAFLEGMHLGIALYQKKKGRKNK